MNARFGEMEARSMRDATEMQPRWMRDESEIWRDAGLCKFSQFSRNLSKLRRILLNGGFPVLLRSPRIAAVQQPAFLVACIRPSVWLVCFVVCTSTLCSPRLLS